MKTKLFTLALLLISAGSFAQNTADAEAVKKACITETENFDKRDLPAILAGFADVPYASRYWTNNAYNGAATIRAVYTKYVTGPPQASSTKRERSNWQLQPLGDKHFWATYDQTSTGQDGKVSYSKEVRLLEKVVQSGGAGQWKLVSVINLPMPEPK